MRAQLLLLLEPSEDEPAQAAIARSALTDPQSTDPQCTACVAADLATNASQQPCSQGTEGCADEKKQADLEV